MNSDYLVTKFHESDLLEDEVEKFSRQIIVPGIGIEGQLLIRNSSVLVVGCGGLGSPLIMYLASCGISRLGIIDHDRIEIHNLQRQVLYKESDIGKYKVDCTDKFIREINSKCQIDKYNFKLNSDNCEKIIYNFNIIVDCTDNIQTRYILSDTSKKLNKDFVCASVIRWEGHLYVFKKDGPCYRCLFPIMKKITSSCDENGIIGPICGLFGSLLGLEIIKLILNITDTKMIRYNGITNTYNNYKLRNRNPNCRECVSDISCNLKTNQEVIIKNYNLIPRKSWNEILENFDKYTIIDVRPAVQFGMIRIKNSKNILINDLSNHIKDIKKYKNVVLVCKRGITSLKGCNILLDNKITCHSIDGGMDEYIKRYKNMTNF